MPNLARKRAARLFGAVIVSLALAAAAPADAQQKTQITVYTALDTDQLAAFKSSAEAALPDIDISWVKGGTGVIAARILAEKENPSADVVWGLAVTSMIMLKQRDAIQSYTPKGAEELTASFRDKANPMAWTGMDAYLSVICFNTIEAQKRNIPAPKTWKDLLDPVYKDEVVMPNPASSGAGYLTVAAWLQLFGEKGGWQYMDDLHKNIAVYTHSGSASCVQAARGERVVGIGFDMRAASEKTKGAPIDIIIPSDGIGWEMEATGIVKGTKKLEAAQRLVDWSVTKEANELYSKYYPIVAHPGVKNEPPANYPMQGRASMIDNDFEWSATNLERILKEWATRYDGKSAPK